MQIFQNNAYSATALQENWRLHFGATIDYLGKGKKKSPYSFTLRKRSGV